MEVRVWELQFDKSHRINEKNHTTNAMLRLTAGGNDKTELGEKCRCKSNNEHVQHQQDRIRKRCLTKLRGTH